MNDVITAISTVGFPIVMSLILFVFLQRESETHRMETNALKDAINKLEIAITSLIAKLGE